MASTQTQTWQPDVKSHEGPIDPAVLPEYTLLPASPPRSVVSYNDPDGASEAGSSASNHNADATTCGIESLKIIKMLYTGILAIVFPPMIIGGAALAAAGVMLYGCGRVLEGIGRGLSIGPEVVFRTFMRKRVKMLRGALREGRRVPEQEQGQVVEGQVALEDVEAGQIGGPIAI
ncbi:hypothetical protein DICSQDRAFT_157787 [Dichomitus squalens LYAD-421 SS1]|uniref:Uncharacterized protein n=1 Tax=Dichomitus squalens (strain LYAD-421) TaxID=732165 RepID=R7SKH2_DICSQ|nr:uncharacterized protein DICSQDRAFT_157787 [Dichomitus squalens LYAD-421 SS1]EJF56641.1 hypothetical protein DICSQDRAFT_157787 [Dichomitus squalens LYAD-421 SS1]